jgi:aminopeptidase N
MNEAYCRRAAALLGACHARRPFAPPGAGPRYAPDRPAAVEHIALELRFDFRAHVLFGRCRTVFRAVGSALHELEMDAGRLAVHAVRSERGAKLGFSLTGGKLHITLDRPLAAGASSAVIIDYEAREPRQGIYFIGPDSGYPTKPVQVWTQGQDEDAHYWFPCIDYPNAKATTEVVATVPAAFFVLSNGALVRTTKNAKAKTVTYHWKMDQPHATYLVSVVAGRFVGHTDLLDGLPVSYYVEPQRAADGARSFAKTPRMLRFFNETIGVTYPYAKYAQIAVRDFIFGGMENTTATTLTDATLHDARAHLDYSSDGLVAHELAHQWFGDLVTCKDWSHAWLNEGFATYCDALFKEHDLGRDEFDYYRLQLEGRYLEEDSRRYRRPIVTNVYAEPIDLFDRHLYEKAACILHMIRRQLGDEVFWQAVRRYVSDHAFGVVETVDLVRAIEHVSGRNLQPFFDQWVHRGGHPEFRVQYTWDAQRKAAVVRVRQVQDTSDGTPVFSMPVELVFGSGKTSTHVGVRIEDADHTFTIRLPRRPEVFAFDPQGDVLKTVSLEVPEDMLVRQALGLPYVRGRIDAIRALGKAQSAEADEALAGVLASRAFWGVRAEAAAALGASRSTRAFLALRDAREDDHPKVRRAVVRALGEFHTDEACAALAPMLRRDASYFVEAEAAHAIGKTRSRKAFALLERALEKPSFNEVIRGGALRGLAELGDERALPLLLAWTAYGKPSPAREAAVEALGKLGHLDRRVRRRLVDLLDDKDFYVRRAAIGALRELRDTEAVEALERLASEDVDGRLKSEAAAAARAILEAAEKPAEVAALREDVERLRETTRSLRDRLERLEAARRG